MATSPYSATIEQVRTTIQSTFTRVDEWSRPEHMIPTGTPSSEEVRARMREQARECLDILEQFGRGEGSLLTVSMSVNKSGRLDVYQWLYFLAQHARRHLDQMQEVEAEAPFK